MTETKTKTARMWPAIIAAVTALMLSPALFCGFELCDSGFYMTFYDNIFSHPDAVSYNFMYYLSGVAGGAIRLLTGDSLTGMRLAGLLACIATALCVYRASKGDDIRMPQFAATVTVCAGILLSPLTFYNDIMTMLLATVSIMLLIRGGGKAVFAAALTAGINTFTRLPNVLEFLFIILILYRERTDRRQALRESGIWCAGWLTGFFAVLAGAALAGHLGYLTEIVHELFGTASEGAQESTHSLRNLIAVLIGSWVRIGGVACGISVAAFCIVWIRRTHLRPAIKGTLSIAAAIAGAALLVISDPVTALAAVCAAGCVCNLFTRCSARMKNLSVAGLLMMAVIPAGSDNGIYNTGTIVLWLAAVPAFASISRILGRPAAVTAACILVAASSWTVCKGGFYFDNTPLTEMTSSIDLPSTHGIRTSAHKASRIGRIVARIGEYVDRGDTLLVFGSAPMLNHLTGTLPALGCSWPELLSPGQLHEKTGNENEPPYIVRMRFNTLGAEWGEPSVMYLQGKDKSAGRYHNEEKCVIMEEYIRSRGYRTLIDDPDFILYAK